MRTIYVSSTIGKLLGNLLGLNYSMTIFTGAPSSEFATGLKWYSTPLAYYLHYFPLIFQFCHIETPGWR